MKNILILGAAGMAGHMIHKYLKTFPEYNVISTARNEKYIIPDYNIEALEDTDRLAQIIKSQNIDIVINCIGLLVKDCNLNAEKGFHINSCFPHYLEDITENTKTKIIHLSTDCVFSGKKGNYSETDIPDETNNYGRYKSIGELENDKDLTLRMSIIGNELKSNGSGLFEWFMRQEGTVKGYNKCLWSGITTLELAKQIKKIIELPTNLSDLYHLVPDFSISKYELLTLIGKIFNKKIIIECDDSIEKNKILINNRKEEYCPNIPDYYIQLQELKEFIK